MVACWINGHRKGQKEFRGADDSRIENESGGTNKIEMEKPLLQIICSEERLQ